MISLPKTVATFLSSSIIEFDKLKDLDIKNREFIQKKETLENEKKIIAATCSAVMLLISAKIIKGKKVAKTWCRIYKNGARKLDQELDVLQMIRHHRLMVSTIAGLMN